MVINKLKQVLFQVYIALLSSIPTIIGIKLRYIAYKPLFKKTSGRFIIDSGVTIEGFENIELGNNVIFMKNSYIYAHNEGMFIVGNNFVINSNSQIGASSGKIVIGNDCAIAPNCVLRAANHTFNRIDIPIKEQGHTYGEINIGNDVWIASNCVITSNTVIEDGAIIGAGSVVTKDVEKYTIVAGVPASFVSKRV